MTLHSPATHTSAHDTDSNLADAARIMTLAGLATSPWVTAEETSATLPKRRGRPPMFGRYTALGVACTMYELVAGRHALSINSMLESMWFRYTDAQLDLIGLGELRTAERMASMRALQGSAPTDRTRARRKWNCEHERLRQALITLFKDIDFTPLRANHSRGQRPSPQQRDAAANSPENRERTAAAHRLFNAIIAASVHHENDKHFPGKSLHDGLLASHGGHLGVDETHLVVSLGDHDASKAPGNLHASKLGHSRAYKYAPASVGLTLAVAVARPDQDIQVPELCLGAAFHKPTSGSGQAVLDIAAAIEHNNLRAPAGSNRRQYVVVDGGYTDRNQLNEGLTALRYSMVMRYAKTRRTLYEVSSQQNSHPGCVEAYLYSGRVLCPGASRAVLARTSLQVPKEKRWLLPGGEVKEGYDPRELATHDATVRSIEALTMRTSGAPRRVTMRARGGQKNGAPTAPEAMQVTVTCPHIAGTARCPVFDGFGDETLAHLPPVPDAPVDLPIGQRPRCCDNESGEMRLNIPLDQFKTWQPHMPGTWEHEDWYTGPRSASERYNDLLKRPLGGTGINRGAVTVRRAPTYHLFHVMAIAVVNRQVVESWLAKHHQNPRPSPASRRKAERAEALAAHRNNPQPAGSAPSTANPRTRPPGNQPIQDTSSTLHEPEGGAL